MKELWKWVKAISSVLVFMSVIGAVMYAVIQLIPKPIIAIIVLVGFIIVLIKWIVDIKEDFFP